ncbi:MAG TPA: cytochrome c [Burkholderiales bacterium]|nr:cytochrome c [Burkholderiales bacterium]
MQKAFAVSVAVALAALSGSAFSQARPENLVKQRQAVMTLQLKYFGPLAAMAQGKVPYNAQTAQRYAGFLDNLSRMPWDGFDPSTKGIKSRALPAIWEQEAKFKQYATQLENEAAKLYAAARSGDEAAFKAQVGAVNKACGSCHDDFRQKQ